MLALLAAITIAVNDRPLDVVALELHDHVLVPMRSLFEALGARVDYDGALKRVVASKDDRRVAFAPGTQGTRIVGNTTYVPLRFVATSLGAAVDYDPGTQLVTVRSAPVVAAVVASPQPVVTREPSPNAQIASAFPTIAATIESRRGATIATVQLRLDGTDVTRDASYSGNSLTYIPRHGLPVGSHTVVITGLQTDGTPINEQWSFVTTAAALPSTGIAGPSYGMYGPLQLSVAGNVFGPNQYMPVQLIAPPGGVAYAYICNSPWQYPMFASPSSSFYSVTLQAPSWGAQALQCPISAMYITPSGQVLYAPYPVYVTLQPVWPQPTWQASPTPAPAPTPVRVRPGPVVTRLPETPAPPAPRAVTQPVATAHPPAVHASPAPRPIRLPPRPRPERTPLVP